MRACPECAHRQETGTACASCGYDGLLDLGDMRHRELLRDIDRRKLDRHTDRSRKIAVALAMAIVMGAWFIPGYWAARRAAIALPFLADQWAIMIVIALGISRLVERMAPKPKFPWIDDYGNP
jgi:hypothetical protein